MVLTRENYRISDAIAVHLGTTWVGTSQGPCAGRVGLALIGCDVGSESFDLIKVSVVLSERDFPPLGKTVQLLQFGTGYIAGDFGGLLNRWEGGLPDGYSIPALEGK